MYTVVVRWRSSDAIQEFDVRNKDDIEAMVRHSDTVYNLIGREWETKYTNIFDRMMN